MIPGVSYRMLGLQGNMHNHQGSRIHQFMDDSEGQHNKASMSDDDDELIFNDNAGEKGQQKGSPWHRMKWTERMVKLLITAVSYLGEDSTMLQKKGKWKAISKVMAERVLYVSPQQCEDKFNDLNKRYKRLTDVLGRGTSCKVVENPALLKHMNNLSEKMKEDVRKILSSKHLFYEEMCSYHNCNRLNLPADPALQHSLHLALQSRGVDEGDRNADSDEEGDPEEHDLSCFPKRMKLGVDREAAVFGASSSSHGRGRNLHPQGLTVEEKRLQIQAEMLELEKQRYKWQRFAKKKDRELSRIRMENERMKLENEHMSLELRQKEIKMDLALKRI